MKRCRLSLYRIYTKIWFKYNLNIKFWNQLSPLMCRTTRTRPLNDTTCRFSYIRFRKLFHFRKEFRDLILILNNWQRRFVFFFFFGLKLGNPQGVFFSKSHLTNKWWYVAAFLFLSLCDESEWISLSSSFLLVSFPFSNEWRITPVSKC